MGAKIDYQNKSFSVNIKHKTHKYTFKNNYKAVPTTLNYSHEVKLGLEIIWDFMEN